MLKLHGCVVDVEFLFGQRVYFEEDAIALRWRNVVDGYVAGQRMALRTEAPDVKIVDVEDALDGFHSGANLAEREAARGAFEQNIQCFADDVDRTPQDQRGDDDR